MRRALRSRGDTSLQAQARRIGFALAAHPGPQTSTAHGGIQSMSKRASFFAELKRRNVYKVAVAYAIVGWLLVQVATQVFPFFEIPNWAGRLIVLAVVIGFPIALVIAWAFELTPEGLKRTQDVDLAPQPRTKSHAWIYIVILGALLSIGLFFVGRFSARNTASA